MGNTCCAPNQDSNNTTNLNRDDSKKGCLSEMIGDQHMQGHLAASNGQLGKPHSQLMLSGDKNMQMSGSNFVGAQGKG